MLFYGSHLQNSCVSCSTGVWRDSFGLVASTSSWAVASLSRMTRSRSSRTSPSSNAHAQSSGRFSIAPRMHALPYRSPLRTYINLTSGTCTNSDLEMNAILKHENMRKHYSLRLSEARLLRKKNYSSALSWQQSPWTLCMLFRMTRSQNWQSWLGGCFRSGRRSRRSRSMKTGADRNHSAKQVRKSSRTIIKTRWTWSWDFLHCHCFNGQSSLSVRKTHWLTLAGFKQRSDSLLHQTAWEPRRERLSVSKMSIKSSRTKQTVSSCFMLQGMLKGLEKVSLVTV